MTQQQSREDKVKNLLHRVRETLFGSKDELDHEVDIHLVEIDSHPSIDPFQKAMELINQEDWQVRQDFVSLPKPLPDGIEEDTEVELLQLIVKNDTDWPVRESATERLIQIGGEKVQSILQEIVDADPHPAPVEAAQRGLIALHAKSQRVGQ